MSLRRASRAYGSDGKVKEDHGSCGVPSASRCCAAVSRCSTAELKEIGKVADEVTAPAGTVLARQGAVAFELFVIIAGTATVTRDGREVATVGPGGFVGEMAVIARTPRNATVTTDTDVDLLILTPPVLTNCSTTFPAWPSTCSSRSQRGLSRPLRTLRPEPRVVRVELSRQ